MSQVPEVALTAVRGNASLALEREVVVGMASDVGCVRTLNEDAAAVVRDTDSPAAAGILAVACDGMGGHAAGEIASRLAIEAISKHWTDDSDPAVALPRAIAQANRAIVNAASLDRD